MIPIRHQVVCAGLAVLLVEDIGQNGHLEQVVVILADLVETAHRLDSVSLQLGIAPACIFLSLNCNIVF